TLLPFIYILFFFNAPATSEIYTLSLHDALPISVPQFTVERRRVLQMRVGELVAQVGQRECAPLRDGAGVPHRVGQVAELRGHFRSEEHTSELQSQSNLVCRLLLEKKKKKNKQQH